MIGVDFFCLSPKARASAARGRLTSLKKVFGEVTLKNNLPVSLPPVSLTSKENL